MAGEARKAAERRREDIEVVAIPPEQCVIQNCCNDAKRQLRFGTTRISLCHWHGADLKDLLNEGGCAVAAIRSIAQQDSANEGGEK